MPTQRLNCKKSFENVRFLAGATDFSHLYNVQASSGAYTASYSTSYSIGTGALSPEESSCGMKPNYHLYLVPRLHLHGVVLN
jgi:hypothetical protein